MKKLVSLFLVLVLSLAVFSGCKDEKKKGTVVDTGIYANELADKVSDSSELPDWGGSKRELVVWYGSGTGATNRNKKAENDVVTPELFRVTGVKFSEEKSFDNGGELMDAKFAKIAAAKDWPDILIEPEQSVLDKLIAQDMVYDLSDYIPKYMPHLQALLEKGGDDPYLKSTYENGAIYELKLYPDILYAYPDIDPVQLARINIPVNPNGFVYVRDDILKMIYPDALTQEDIEKIYEKNGKFTEEEILNCAFESKEEFFEFLYKVQQLDLKKGNRKVYPTYAADGTDNWMLMTYLGSLYGRYVGGGSAASGATYFTYYDKEKKSVEYMYEQDFFKDCVKDWNKLVQDNVASKDSLIDNRAAFEEKVNNGEYAVIYGSSLPSITTINQQSQGYKYRKVYLDIPVNYDKFLFASTGSTGKGYAILKESVSEEELPQVLRFFDFMLTDVGQKLVHWGPRSAGLFEEIDGERVFTDKELEECAVYDVPNDKLLYYGLQNKQWPGYPSTVNKYHPKLTYDVLPKVEQADRFFDLGTVRTAPRIKAINADIMRFDEYGCDSVDRFWSARTAFEEALTKVFTAKTDAEFETLYADVIKIAQRNGLTDDTKKELNKLFKEMNKDYWENIK